MNVLVLDYETFFDTKGGYTLKKMTTEAYVRDPRFKAHMVALKYGKQGAIDAPAHLLRENESLRRDVEQSAVVMHHAHFDALILSHHYGLRPKFIFDTLSMARLVLPRLKSHSLEALAQHFGLPSKTVPYNLFDGVRDLPHDIYAPLAAGARHDAALTYEIFQRLLPFVPKEELQVIDTTVRMFSEPVLRLDRPRLEQFLQAERIRKAKAMLAAGEALGLPPLPLPCPVDDLRQRLDLIETELQSSTKFRTALELLGYDCPVKWSNKASGPCEECHGLQTQEVLGGDGATLQIVACSACNGSGKAKGGWIPALAKDDEGMRALLEHEDSRVQALAAARLGVKATLNETRAERFLEMDMRGPATVYLKYCGAGATLRWSGADAIQYQNLPRGGELRKAILAPEGHKLAVGDLSQIEYRLLCWIAGQWDKLEALIAGRDLYSEMATGFYRRPISKNDKAERGVGKQVTLSCGYGAGGPSIVHTAALGTYGPPVKLTDAEGLELRDLYRSTHPEVTKFWRACEVFLRALATGQELTYKCLRIAGHKIHMPNGTALDYTGLRWARTCEIFPNQPDDGEGPSWWRPATRGWARTWGSKVTADVVQGLARVVIAHGLVRIAQRQRVVLTVHDETVSVVPDAEAGPLTDHPIGIDKAVPGTALHFMLETLITPPAWCPDIPLDAEGIVSERYEK